MAYTKKVWKDAPDTSTPINAANLNHMEDGIATADVNAQNALDRLDDVDDEITQINSDLSNVTPQMVKAVTADGVKTYRQLLYELYDSTVISKFRNSSIHIGNKTFHNVDYDNTHGLRYSGSIVYEDGYELETIQVSPSQSICAFFTYDKTGFHTFSNTVATSGTVLSLWVHG